MKILNNQLKIDYVYLGGLVFILIFVGIILYAFIHTDERAQSYIDTHGTTERLLCGEEGDIK